LDHTVQNLYTRIENQMAAYSRIEDADYAVESAQLARMQVLQQAGTAMLAQANASSIGVLALLK
jgi:flagellin